MLLQRLLFRVLLETSLAVQGPRWVVHTPPSRSNFFSIAFSFWDKMVTLIGWRTTLWIDSPLWEICNRVRATEANRRILSSWITLFFTICLFAVPSKICLYRWVGYSVVQYFDIHPGEKISMASQIWWYIHTAYWIDYELNVVNWIWRKDSRTGLHSLKQFT